MQLGAVSVLTCLAVALTATGCVERDPHSASDVAAAHAFHARQSALALRDAAGACGATAPAKVRCRCDADGGLHVQAPQGSNVAQVSEESSEDAEVEITLAERASGTPIRQTVSLGFIGDNKLNESPARHHGNALLPPHVHGLPDHPHGYGSSYGYRGHAGYGYGVSRGHGGHVQRYSGGGAAPSGGHSTSISPPLRSSGRSGPSHGFSGSSGGRASSGRAPR